MKAVTSFVVLLVERDFPRGQHENSGPRFMAEDGSFQFEEMPVAGQPAAPDFSGLKEGGLPTAIGAEVNIQAGHAAETDDAIDRILRQPFLRIRDEGAVASHIGKTLLPQFDDLDSLGPVAFPGATEDGHVISALGAEFCDIETVPLGTAEREIFVNEKGQGHRIIANWCVETYRGSSSAKDWAGQH